jgi:hypothetical protein
MLRLVEAALGLVEGVRSAAVAQGGRDGVDRELDALADARVGFARAVAFHQFDLEQVERSNKVAV